MKITQVAWGLLALSASAGAEMPGIDGLWKLDSEYPGRQTYFFEVKEGQSHLVYPPEKSFEGQVPHASNAFKPVGADAFVLSPNVKAPGGQWNLFENLFKQTGLAGFQELAKKGLTYKRNDQGEFIPQIPDELKTWLPKMRPATRDEVRSAKAAGDRFDREVAGELLLSFPKEDPISACPEGMRTLIEFSQEGFDEVKKVVRFQVNYKDYAKVLEGSSKGKLYVQSISSEGALAFAFMEGEKLKFPLVKTYQVSGDQWVVPTGKKDSISGAPLCQRFHLRQALQRTEGAAGAQQVAPKPN